MRAARLFFVIFISLALAACESDQIPPPCKIEGALTGDAVAAATDLELTPEILAPLLFRGNNAIHLASLAVHQAKTEMNRARAELLPSIRLGSLLFSAGQPQFAWTAVESALPFLVPSNWFKADLAREVFEAQKLALQVVEQNQFAQVYSMIRVWQVDSELAAHLDEELREAEGAADRIARAYEVGAVSVEERNRSDALAAQAALASVRMRELVLKEEASLRRAFSLKAGVRLFSRTPWVTVPASDTEGRVGTEGVEAVLEEALKVVPEYLQMTRLIEASRDDVWSSIFGFVGGVGAVLVPNASGSLAPSLSRLSVGGGLNFGVSLIPTIQLSQLRVREMELRQLELKQEIRQVLEGLAAQLESTRSQLVIAQAAEQSLKSLFDSLRLRLELGLATLAEFEAAEGAWRESVVARLRAAAELELSRLAWQRTLQEGRFAELPPCLVESAEKK